MSESDSSTTSSDPQESPARLSAYHLAKRAVKSAGSSTVSSARRAGQRSTLWHRLRRKFSRSARRQAPRTEQTMLPVLIQVFAGFTKLDGRVAEAEIDSILGFLRYDYPETVYSELRELYATALRQPQDLDEIARDLASRLPLSEKILLGVQLYVLISRAGLPKENLITFYQFMTNLGVASEAINIVYQLNTSETVEGGTEPITDGDQPLETIIISRRRPADVVLEPLSDDHAIAAFRFRDLILIKNIGAQAIIARGRSVSEGEFCRIYESQHVLIGEMVLDYQDLAFYFNAKKNVSGVELFLAQDHDGNQFIEKARTKHSYLDVKFGLNITVNVLRDMDAHIGKVPLKRGATMEVSIRDKIVFEDRTEIPFSDLRRRARELGGRFNLLATRSEYLVSNNPTKLREGDILLSPGARADILLRITCNYFEKSGELEVIESPQPVLVDDVPVKSSGTMPLADGVTVTVAEGQYLRCHFSDGIIEEERNVINSLHVVDVSHSYDRRRTAMDNISFSIQRGEMVCVMGPSGCGKSTLLKTLAGQLQPDFGRVELNKVSLYDELEDLTPYIAFIPHEDAFDPLLTVEENLDTSAAIRAPHLSRLERRRRADAKLVELGLSEFRHRLAGDDRTKSLSGGQRKRLNAGMDMIGIADIYLFDEPTSGLSSKDSEHVLDLIRGLTHNKITLVSIHQPSSRLFHMFDKAILLDNGGKLAFFGTPTQMLQYFAEARKQEGVHQTAFDDPLPDECAKGQALTPDFVFDVLETPLRDLSGDIIYEQDQRGQLMPARRFSPGFWGDRFQTYRLLEEVNLRSIESDSSGTVMLQKAPHRPVRTLSDDWIQFTNQLKRAFWSKLRNRANLATTLLEAPALAFLVAMVLRYSEDGEYNFASAFHIPTYLFLTLVIGLFLGLTNSAEEIIRDRTLLERERNHGIRVGSYILSKVLSLGFFALIQCVIYLLIADSILSIRDMFWHNLFWMFATAFVGIAAGLCISSLVNTPKTALNIIPLIMIPNIILGGALIKYEEMNRSLDVITSIKHWIGSGSSLDDEDSKLKVPAICQLMPLRWSYESIIIAHAERNPVRALINDIESILDEFKKNAEAQKPMTPDDEARLDAAKDALAIVYGLDGERPGDVRAKIRRIREGLMRRDFNPAEFLGDTSPGERVTAEELYLNEKVLDLFNAAEVERRDYRRGEDRPNVFFGKEKRWMLSKGDSPDEESESGGGYLDDSPVVLTPATLIPGFFQNHHGRAVVLAVNTLHLNAVALFVFAGVGLVALRVTLKRQMRKV
ncbi:MAG: ATP-binding cassette domain-containing protein [Verrucomicrobiae bacterium]|nr:ATP-binding cassette domain-containing protein [Verrucomicrobiae bacterium]